MPTIAEAGLPGFVSEQRYGLLAPAGTPRPDSPEDYAAAIEQDRVLWGGIVKKLGLRVE